MSKGDFSKVPLLGLQAVTFWFSHSLSSVAFLMVCLFLIGLSGFIRESQDYKGLRVSLGAFLLAKVGTILTKLWLSPYFLVQYLLFLLFDHGILTQHQPGTTDFTSQHLAGYLLGAQSLHPTLAQGNLIL